MGEAAATEDHASTGLELAHYAWVTAALAEGFGLDEVLRAEGVEPARWRQAELGWRTRLGTDPTIQEEYRTHLARAEDELGGKVTPLGDDLEAWVLFLRVYGDHPAPFELLAEHGLRPGDLARLHRVWARRLDADEDLVERATKLREKVAEQADEGGSLSLPSITVARGSLQASPYARAALGPGAEPGAASDRSAAPSPASPLPDLSLYEYAALCAALDDVGVDEGAVLQAHGLRPTDRAPLDRAWRRRMDADPALAADFRNLHRHFNEREGFRGAPGPGREPVVAPPPVASHPRPAVVPSGPAGPWAGPQPRPPAAPTPSPGPVAPERRPGYNADLGMTLEGVRSIPRSALPFSPKRPSVSSPQEATEVAEAPSVERPSAAASRSAPPAPVAAGVGPEHKPGYNKDLARTAKVGDKVPLLTLPFRATPPPAISDAEKSAAPAPPEPAPSPPAKRSAPPASSAAAAGPGSQPGYNKDLARTAKVGDRVPHITLPFQAKPGPDGPPGAGEDGVPDDVAEGPAAPEPTGAIPASSPAGAGHQATEIAGWRIDHYASFCAELAEHPDRAVAIRARYGLADEAAEQYLHERWQMRFVEDDEARRQWQQLLQQYRRLLAQSR